MMRELTDHETTLVSGGFGTGDISVDLPDSAVPYGGTFDNLTDVQFELDTATNQLTTILTFDTANSHDTRLVFHGGDQDAGGQGTVVQTRTTATNSGSTTLSGGITFTIKLPGPLGKYLTGTITGSGTYTTPTKQVTTTTEITRPYTPPHSGGVGGSGSPGKKNPYVRPN